MLPTPADALWARIRESRFSFRNAVPVVNFLVTFAILALLGPKAHSWPVFAPVVPKVQFSRRNALLGAESLFGSKGVKFHQETIGFISIRGMGAEKCTFCSKVHFGAKSALLVPKCVLGPKSSFWSRNPLFGDPVGQVAILVTCM